MSCARSPRSNTITFFPINHNERCVDVANKNIKKIVQKMKVIYQDWHEVLPFAFYIYCTSVRISIRATPYQLLYMEVVNPIEVKISSLRLLMEANLEEAEWI